jgi:SAM-dependent methyltransferase
MYDPARVRSFYDALGEREWARLEGAHGRLQATLHDDFIKQHVFAGARVLDAGCGPGRFSVTCVQAGARVTLLDLSPVQLALARSKLQEAGALDGAEAFVEGDLGELSTMAAESFDVVVCFGGPLSYVGERRREVAAGLVRVVKRGGVLLVSVISRYGSTANLVRRATMAPLRSPVDWHVWRVIDDGELPGFPSTIGEAHPPLHLFTSAELRQLFEGCEVVDMAAACASAVDSSERLDEIARDPVAWQTVVAIERRLSRAEGMLDVGNHILMAARRV